MPNTCGKTCNFIDFLRDNKLHISSDVFIKSINRTSIKMLYKRNGHKIL